jgi:hypothetical protein
MFLGRYIEALQDFNFGYDPKFRDLCLSHASSFENDHFNTNLVDNPRYALSIDAMEVAATVWICVDKRNIGQTPNFSHST